MPKGKILSVADGGSVWQIFYQPEDGGIDHVIFDWRQFAHFYEGTSGRSFYHDYRFGHGRDVIKDYFKGKTLVVDGEDLDERVALED